MTALIDDYDGAFFDLDGVIYISAHAVDGAVDAMAALVARGVRVLYVTNNAARDAQTVIDQLTSLGFAADADTVLTSAQVGAAELARALPSGAKVLVAGSRNLVDLVAAAGLAPVFSADDEPVAVIQGYDPTLTWPMLDEVCLALQRGARWYATNGDLSRPTDRGLVPGVGGMIAAVAAAVGGEPITFGKPFRPMLDEAVRRSGASRPIFVGDRLDTDVVGANRAGLDSLLVFSGAHGKAELVLADASHRPTFIGADVRALLEPPRVAQVSEEASRCGAATATIADGEVRLSSVPPTRAGQLDAVWAVATLAWRQADAGHPVATRAALAPLTLVR